jgi:hypothetical protein
MVLSEYIIAVGIEQQVAIGIRHDSASTGGVKPDLSIIHDLGFTGIEINSSKSVKIPEICPLVGLGVGRRQDTKKR